MGHLKKSKAKPKIIYSINNLHDVVHILPPSVVVAWVGSLDVPDVGTEVGALDGVVADVDVWTVTEQMFNSSLIDVING